MLKECQILLSLQKKDLKVQEVKLAEEQARSLYPLDGWDLLAEQEELHTHVAGIEEECVIEAEELAVLVVKASNTLMDLEMPPIQEVLMVVGVILECL
jgi:hypothetical protein